MDVFVVRKLGMPGHPELAMGAIASGGVRVMNEDVLSWYRPSPSAIDAVFRAEQAELNRRERAYRDGGLPLPIEGRTVILVDDGLATGSTMRAAVLAIRRLRPSRVVVAVPVGARGTCEALRAIADDVVCALMPEPFSAVGPWYIDFSQTTDDEVRQLIRLAFRATAMPEHLDGLAPGELTADPIPIERSAAATPAAHPGVRGEA
jgi:predicted phosphoribosyltransferase